MSKQRTELFDKPQQGPFGLLHIGHIEQTPGHWVPLYESPEPKDRPSINTPEGWNMLGERLGKYRAD